MLTFHLLGNAHLDPVWLWDWREGLNEGITTSRAVLDLMDEDPELTFLRGEAAIYEHIETHDPATFRRIRTYVEAGRWDPVGGTVVQSDTNLTSTETFLHSFLHGQRYFRSRFGRPARVAWFADSFGHSAGLPEIFAACGIEAFAFTRPAATIVPIAKPVFWWEGSGGSRVLAYRPAGGWYGTERESVPQALDTLLAAAQKTDLENVGVFFGLGDHGGGPSRRHVQEARAWAKAHPEVRVLFSTLHGLMDALKKEVEEKPADFLPVHKGELNFCLRGCYSSLSRVKYLFRRTEALTARAERTATAIQAAIDPGASGPSPQNAWAGLAFNSFHDVLPGSMIERAAEDQIAWLGGAFHRSQRVENHALLQLAQKIDTTVRAPGPDLPAPVPLLVWNPHPWDYEGPVAMEASLDYRPIWPYRGRVEELPVELLDADGAALPMQVVQTEHTAMPDLPWRKRVVTRLSVPALGWRLLTLGWREGAQQGTAPRPVSSPQAGSIDNGTYRVSAKVGDRGIRILHSGKAVLSSPGLHALTVSDPYGSWGGMSEEPESLDLSTVVAQWQVAAVQVLEKGPERGLLWVRMEGGASRLDLRVSLARWRPAVDFEARLLWNERSARLKLVLPCGADQAEFEVPGGVVTRPPCGEVPGGRWVRALSDGAPVLGFASDALYGFDLKDGALRATVVRASRYACDRILAPEDEPWTPAADAGELRLRFTLSPGDAGLPRLARELEEPLVAVPVPPSTGTLPRTGSLLRLKPDTARILAFRPAEDGIGLVLCIQSEQEGVAQIDWLGRSLTLGPVAAGKIASWRLTHSNGRWVAKPAEKDA